MVRRPRNLNPRRWIHYHSAEHILPCPIFYFPIPGLQAKPFGLSRVRPCDTSCFPGHHLGPAGMPHPARCRELILGAFGDNG